jgi:integrase
VSLKIRDIVQFALGAGMRMGEILSLSWRMVDLTRRTAMVFQSKNGERRTIPLNQTVLNLIKGRGTLRSLSTDLVFPSKTHTPLESGHLRRAFRVALKKARIEDFHFHDLAAYLRDPIGSGWRRAVCCIRCSGFWAISRR